MRPCVKIAHFVSFCLLLSVIHISAASLPLAFEPNRGQTSEPGALYLARLAGHGLLLVKNDGFEFMLPGKKEAVVRFAGATGHSLPIGAAPLPGRASYFLPPSHRLTGVPQYGRIRFHEIYPGIDAALHGSNGALEYDFLLAPHADARRIRLRFSSNVTLENGELILRAGERQIRERRPAAYQEIGGERRSIACRYRLAGHREAGVALGQYNPNFPVVIDPVMWVSYLGGSDGVFGNNLAVDAQGNTYSAGWNPQSSTSMSVTVVKLNPEGTKALLTSSVTAPGDLTPKAIVLDSAGFIYVAGTTNANSFPTTPGAYQTSGEGFLFKLGPDGKLQYSTMLHAMPAAIAVDSGGHVYLTGAASTDFVTTPGVFQPAIAAGQCPATSNLVSSVPCPDAFVLKLNPQATGAVYATFLGGSYADEGSGIAVDAAGAARITGATGSPDFPLAGAGSETSFHGLLTVGPLWFGDAFVTELSPDAQSLVFSTYLGGSGPDQGFSIGVDAYGYTYVAGQTSSSDFPVTKGAYRSSIVAAPPAPPSLGIDGFVTRFNADGSIDSSTYFEGTGAMIVEASGDTYLQTIQKPTGSIPTCNQRGAWAEVLRADGTILIQPPGYPGAGFNGSTTMGLDAEGNAYVTGVTTSMVFLATPGAYQTQFSSDHDGYVGKIDFAASPPRSIDCLINAGSLTVGAPEGFPDGSVSPGEIVTLYGHDIGPSTPQAGTISGSRFTAQIGDTQVFFNGIAAPLLYAGPGQINAVVPMELENPTTLVLRRGGVDTGPISLPVQPAVPGIFLAGDPALEMPAVFNQDGSLNTPSNPAARGSVITFYATGAGLFRPAEPDGEILPLSLPLPVPAQGASVLIGGKEAPVEYAGAAPGEVAGLVQINAVVPANAPTGAVVGLQLYIGNYVNQAPASPGSLTIAVR